MDKNKWLSSIKELLEISKTKHKRKLGKGHEEFTDTKKKYKWLFICTDA